MAGGRAAVARLLIVESRYTNEFGRRGLVRFADTVFAAAASRNFCRLYTSWHANCSSAGLLQLTT
jgi:hypothetical protein